MEIKIMKACKGVRNDGRLCDIVPDCKHAKIHVKEGSCSLGGDTEGYPCPKCKELLTLNISDEDS